MKTHFHHNCYLRRQGPLTIPRRLNYEFNVICNKGGLLAKRPNICSVFRRTFGQSSRLLSVDLHRSGQDGIPPCILADKESRFLFQRRCRTQDLCDPCSSLLDHCWWLQARFDNSHGRIFLWFHFRNLLLVLEVVKVLLVVNISKKHWDHIVVLHDRKVLQPRHL